MIAAVIVAAGQGLRMGSAERKQFMHLGGIPIIVHSIQRFISCSTIDSIVVVLPPDEIDHIDIKRWFDPLAEGKVRFVAGGADRCESVFKGLCAIEAEDGIVLIHDGVRPLVPRYLIEDCIRGARQWEACIPALAAVDTVKRINENAVVQETLPRQHIFLTQTPQAFKLSLIRNAHLQARNEQIRETDDDPTADCAGITDDASLLEQAGVAVKVIRGAEMNIKITTPLDLKMAEAYLQIMNSSNTNAMENKPA